MLGASGGRGEGGGGGGGGDDDDDGIADIPGVADVEGLAPWVTVNLQPVWVDNDDTTVTVRVESNSRQILQSCADIVRLDVAANVKGQDYTGDEGRILRDEATAWAIERSRLYGESQDAYRDQGGGALASELAEQGRAAGDKMADANRRASEAIFLHRNQGHDDLYLDLHGLTVKEALRFLGERLQKHLMNDTDDSLECVTGAGNHSPNHLAKIKLATHELITNIGLKYEVKNQGTYIIHC